MRANFPLAFAGQSIGLLGGSFDPPHQGHVAITRAALRGFGLDRVWWLVSPGNPLKAHGPMPMEQRIAAARQLLHDPRVVITGIERQLGTRMTADTIAALQRHYPGVRFVWLMGSDNLMQFNRWDRWREIAARVPIGVLSRPGTQLAARRARAAQILADYRVPATQARRLALMPPPAWAMIDLPRNPASSSVLRAAPGYRWRPV